MTKDAKSFWTPFAWWLFLVGAYSFVEPGFWEDAISGGLLLLALQVLLSPTKSQRDMKPRDVPFKEWTPGLPRDD